MAFIGAGVLELNQTYSGTVTGFASGDTIDLHNLTFASATETAVWTQNGASGTLSIYSSGVLDESVNLAGGYNQNDFSLIGDAGGGTSGGTDIIWNPTTITAPESGATASDFVTVDDPGTLHGTANGINGSGVIVGSAALDVNNDTGWEYNGNFSTIAVAGAQDSDVNNINNLGEVAGFYSPVRSTPRYGFVDNNGSYTDNISVPPGTSTTVSINDAGVLVGGSYQHAVPATPSPITPVYTGFIDNGGTITYLNAPGALNSDGYTNAIAGINDASTKSSALSRRPTKDFSKAFSTRSGTFTTVDDPEDCRHGHPARHRRRRYQ